MSSYNSITVVGNLGRDPEQRSIGDGDRSVTSFPVATSRKYKTRDGDQKEDTQWHSVQVWGPQGENCAKYLNKGSLVLVSGEMRYRKYTGKDDVERISAEISADKVQFLNTRNGGGNGNGNPSSGEGDLDF